jgi:hypothetical protein
MVTNDDHNASSASLILLSAAGGSIMRMEIEEKITSKIEISATAVNVPLVRFLNINVTRFLVDRNPQQSDNTKQSSGTKNIQRRDARD